MKFSEKNDFIVKNKSDKFFEQDFRLFKECCPHSNLHASLKRVNSFNKRILDGNMLYELLQKKSPEEILKNRDNPEEKNDNPKKEPVLNKKENSSKKKANMMNLKK